MKNPSRRDVFKVALLGAAPLAPDCKDRGASGARRDVTNARGIEGQRKADLGDGTFMNPIIAGDHPDPTVLKDGENYYMTFSSFNSYPGVVIWESRDLVNWIPIGPAVRKPLGSIWAMDLIKHHGRFYIYIPADPGGLQSVFVIYADDIRGPWSEPIDLKLPGCIDPGHAVGEDDKRYLFVNGVRRIALTDDGLATIGALEHAYSPWRYPDDWVVEMFAPEGPKLLKKGQWYYLITAVGGTAGPPTSHMVIVARSKSIHGPWVNCPHNPVVRTASADEPWWSRGHATVVEGPRGDWWMLYHAYENGFRTLGRQTILEPIEWTADGWFRAKGGILDRPLRKPNPSSSGMHGFALSDDFSNSKIGTQWSFFAPGENEMKRALYEARALRIEGKGRTLAESSPLTFIVGDKSYEAEAVLEIGEDAEAGITLFYSEKMFCGLGFSRTQMFTYHNGVEHSWMRVDLATRVVRVKVSNDLNVVTFYYMHDGKTWTKHPWQMEVSGFHHNVFGGFLSLRLGIYSTGRGVVEVRDFVYAAR